MPYVKLVDLLTFYKRRWRSNRKPYTGKTVRYLSKLVGEYGDHTVIHTEPVLRDQQAEVLAIRLALPKKHVLNQLERCHKLTNAYHEENK